MVKQISLFFITTLCFFLINEAFIKISNIGSVSSTEFYDDIGRGYRKNLNYLYFNEGFGMGKFNEYRYIGTPRSPEKDTNTVRVVLLGDSYTESLQIFERNYFGVVAENLLNNNILNRKYEFLNFGRSGFDIADMYAYHKVFAENFNPDYIFYMISSKDLVPVHSDPLVPRPVYRMIV